MEVRRLYKGDTGLCGKEEISDRTRSSGKREVRLEVARVDQQNTPTARERVLKSGSHLRGGPLILKSDNVRGNNLEDNMSTSVAHACLFR